MAKEKQVAVIDIGSNTVRLVIYKLTRLADFHELQNVKLPVRLYQYLDEKGELAKAGINQLVEVIQLFQKVMSHYQLDQVIATATAVIRQAHNQKEVLTEVNKATGMKLRLLSEEEEASYGQYAIARSTQYNEGYTVDMGGGSTEITYFKSGKIRNYHSFPFGVVTLKNMFFTDEDKPKIKQAQEFLKAEFGKLDWIQERHLPIIAIGGSSRNVASVHQRLHSYPMSGIHEYEMNRKNLQETCDLFASMNVSQLQNLDGLSRDRADIILPANVLFVALYEQVAAQKFVFCHRGLREGLLMEYLNGETPGTYTPNNVRENTVKRLADMFVIDDTAASQRLNIARLLVKKLQEADLLYPTKNALGYLEVGSFLYHVGAYVEEDDSFMHSFYLLANSNLSGYAHRERLAIALVASYKNKSLFAQFLSQYGGWLNMEELSDVREVGSIIKFCDALAITRVNELKELNFKAIDKKTIQLQATWQYDPMVEYYRGNRQKKNLENVIGKSIELDFKKVKENQKD